MRLVKVFNTARQTVVGDKVQVADTFFTRLFGLLGKRHLDPGRGLWIKPSSGVHTLGMMFPIDVIGLDNELRVLRLWPNVAPFRVTGVSARVRSVIELPSGRIAECNVQLGDRLEVSWQDCPAHPRT